MVQEMFIALFILSGVLFPFSSSSIRFIPTQHDQGVGLEPGRFLPELPYKPAAPILAETAELSELSSKSAVIIDTETGSILFQKNSDERLPVASLTKLATAMIFLETEPNFQSEVILTSSVNRLNGAKLFVGDGDSASLIDVFFSSLVGSTNNSTMALAQSTGLSNEMFVQRMNEKASSLGLTKTNFVEPTGLDPDNISTAKEIGLLARQAFFQPLIQKGTTKANHEMRTIKNREYHNVKSTNRLLAMAPEITGSKTGYLDEAGYCLITQAKVWGDREVIVVVLGAPANQKRFDETLLLLDWVKKSYTIK